MLELWNSRMHSSPVTVISCSLWRNTVNCSWVHLEGFRVLGLRFFLSLLCWWFESTQILHEWSWHMVRRVPLYICAKIWEEACETSSIEILPSGLLILMSSCAWQGYLCHTVLQEGRLQYLTWWWGRCTSPLIDPSGAPSLLSWLQISSQVYPPSLSSGWVMVLRLEVAGSWWYVANSPWVLE